MRVLRADRASRRRWSQATTRLELGELTALWLEGALRSHPGCQPGTGPDEETTELVPTLARLNRAGFLTWVSQPGVPEGMTSRGTMWAQRAGVEGFTDSASAEFLADRAEAAGMRAEIQHVSGRWHRRRRTQVTCTTCDGKPVLGLAVRASRADVRLAFGHELHPHALREIYAGVQLTLLDEQWGVNDLWPVLDQAVAELIDTDLEAED